jgi:OmcA/MtrC family decaheme c-type cytochrome
MKAGRHERRVPWRAAANRWISGFCIALTIGVLQGCDDDDDNGGGGGGGGGVVPPPAIEEVDLGDGIVAKITAASIGADRVPVVEFELEDDEGNPIALSQLDGNPSFVAGWIDVDDESGQTRYQSHIVRPVSGAEYTDGGMTVDPVMATADQAGTDRDGTFETLSAGKHRYRFGITLPESYERTATHSIGLQTTREARGFVDNEVFHFVPAGGTPVETREVALTETCNECHGTLAIHGGSRREVGLCVICHTDQTVDPETGENLDFGHMIHKIHRGEGLTTLPYIIVGNRQSVHDYSEVVFPQDIRNCETCHVEPVGAPGAAPAGATDSENWRIHASRADCGACHDDVNFETGENHSSGIQQFDDFLCNRCHRSEQVEEFDNTIPGAHTVPYHSSVNPELTLAITDVQGMTVGGQPSVRFTTSDKNGPVDITTLDRVGIIFAGPTEDYQQLLGANSIFTVHGGGAIGTLTTNSVGDYTFVPDGFTIPADTAGTWSVGMEARTANIDTDGTNIRFGANNPVVHIDLENGTLGGGSPVARRVVVDEANCKACHNDVLIHGNLRTDLAYCVLCHNSWATDETRRPNLDPATNPPATIDFEVMIHKIHRGTDLAQPYTVFGFGNTPHDFTRVEYPGDLRDCETCHVDGSHLLPGPDGRSANVVNIAGAPVPSALAIQTPTSAACTGCHDDEDTVTHTRINSIVVDASDFAESCAVCHGEGASVSVSEAHAIR